MLRQDRASRQGRADERAADRQRSHSRLLWFARAARRRSRVGAGKLTGLIGPNGAGKSTLFNAISGLSRPMAAAFGMDDARSTALPPERMVERGLVRTFQLARGFPKLDRVRAPDAVRPRPAGRATVRALRRCAAARAGGSELAARPSAIARRLRLGRSSTTGHGACRAARKSCSRSAAP